MPRLLPFVAAAFLATTPAFAQEQDLTIPEARALAALLAREGRVSDAAQVAELLIARDPRDVAALILLSEIAIRTGDFRTGYRLGARAYAAASDRESLFVAARQTARAHAELGNDTRAQIWLRRARQYAPTPDAATAVARDFQFLRDRNPLSVNLSFGALPSTNVNGGSAKENVALFGLPGLFVLNGEARALSGLEVSASTDLRYRLNLTATSATFASVSASYRTYSLSSSARQLAPDAKGSDFADGTLTFGLNHRQIFREGMRPTGFDLNLGQTFYAGEPYTRFVGVNAEQSWAFDPKNTLGLVASYRLTRYLTDDNDTAGNRPAPDTTIGLNGFWTRQLDSGNQLQLTLGARQNRGDDADREYDSLITGVSYRLARPVAGVALSGALKYEYRTYDFSSLAGGVGRTDTTWSGRVTARFPMIEFYGFQPEVALDLSRSESSVDRFDRDNVSLGFDLVSAF